MGVGWINTDCVCEIAAKASARQEPNVRRGIMAQRLQRDWIGVKATQLAQGEREKKRNMTSFNTAWTRTRRETERERERSFVFLCRNKMRVCVSALHVFVC